MEQMMNQNGQELGEKEGFSSWRSIGAVAADWAEQARARRDEEAAPHDDHRFVPVAWAAE